MSHDVPWEPMKGEHPTDEEEGRLLGVHRVRRGHEMDHLCEAVHEHQDRCELVLSLWKTHHEIHAYRLPGTRGDGQWLQ